MITLGGWLFADLLLGLSMLFLVANTVGAPPPEPTPTPLPDYLATAEAQIAQSDQEAQQTFEALQGQLTDAEAAAQATEEAVQAQSQAAQTQEAVAQATEDAEATREALTANERATMDAQATEDAVVAQATIEALSTEQALNQSSQEELSSELATTVAQATEVASQVEAQGTEQAELDARITAQGTEQAQLQAQATENAESGVNAQGTTVALQNQIATSEASLATTEAQSAQAQANAESAQATSDAAENQLLQAQEQVQLNSLNPNAVPVTIQVNLSGVISGDDDALEDAREELGNVLNPYLEAESCRLGFVLISSRAPDIGQGIQLSNRIAVMIEEDFTEILPEPADGGEPVLASESIALPGTAPTGEVELLLFLSSGCQIDG
jgi:hypothetical protein